MRGLVISPDAALWLAPWAALPLADGRYLVEQYELSYVVTGRDLLAQEPTLDRRPAKPPLIFADPDFDLGAAQASASTQAVLRNRFTKTAKEDFQTRAPGLTELLPRVQRLPATAREAKLIQPEITKYAGAEPIIYAGRFALEGVFKAIRSPRVLAAQHAWILFGTAAN